MLFTFGKGWKTLAALAASWLACEFIGFELTVVTLLVLLVCKNSDDSRHLI